VFLTLIFILIGAWALFMGWKFYRSMDWEEPVEPSPDLQAMHKREGQLLMVQDILEEAASQGKLSQGVVDEFSRYSESEIHEIRAVETAWKNRRKKTSASN